MTPDGSLIHEITPEALEEILVAAGYTVEQRQGGTIVAVSPEQRPMVFAVIGCVGQVCIWMRARAFVQVPDDVVGGALLEAYDSTVPPAMAMLVGEEGQRLLVLGRDVYLAPGVTPTNLLANIAAVETMTANAEKAVAAMGEGSSQ